MVKFTRSQIVLLADHFESIGEKGIAEIFKARLKTPSQEYTFTSSNQSNEQYLIELVAKLEVAN